MANSGLEMIQEPEKVLEIIAEQVVYIGGSDNSSKIISTNIAGMILSGHLLLVKSSSGGMFAADKDTPEHMHRIAGIGLNSATEGSVVQVQSFGELVEPTWNWMDGPVYLGNNGLLTQTVPTTGFLLLVGTALAPTVLRINLGAPISLA